MNDGKPTKNQENDHEGQKWREVETADTIIELPPTKGQPFRIGKACLILEALRKFNKRPTLMILSYLPHPQ